MKKIIFISTLLLLNFLAIGQNCGNMGFEDGTSSGWICRYGTYGAVSPAATCGPADGPTNLTSTGCLGPALNSPIAGTGNRHTVMSQAGTDPLSNNTVTYVAPANMFPSNTNSYSFRLGNTLADGVGGLALAESIEFSLLVTAQNAGLTYLYSAFLMDPNHLQWESPRFEIKITTANGTQIPCGKYQVIAGTSGISGWQDGATVLLNGANVTWKYKPWTKVGLDLTGYIGQTLTIQFITSDCFPSSGTSTTCTNGVCSNSCTPAPGSHSAYAYIDMYCVPLIIDAPIVCSNQSTAQICAPPGFATYSWPAGQPGITGAPTTQCVTVNNPTPGITYTVNMTSVAGGCPTKTTVTLTGFDFNVRDTTICQGSSFPLNVTPTAPGTFNYSWAPATNLSCTNCQNPTFTPGSTTTYTITMTDPAMVGCSKTKTVTVTVQQTTSVTATGATVCSGISTTLNAVGQSCGNSVTYSWAPNTFLSSTTGATVTAVNPTATTTYTITVTSASGQTATATALLTVNPNPVISVPPATICDGTSTTLTASGATTYTWSPTTGLSSGTGASVTANPTVTTTYTVTGSVATGCTGVTTVVVTVNPNPVVTVPSATICPGASAPLTASGATTYTWSPSTGLSSTTGTTVTANPTATTTYTVIGTSLGCTGSATVVVTLLPPCGPGVNATGSTVCDGICGSVTSTAFGGTPPYSYLWNTGETTSGMTPAACPAVTTTYTVTVTDNSVPIGTASAIAVITVNPNPVVSVGPATICNGASATLTASGATTYTWSPTTGLSSGAGTTVTANPVVTTTYTVVGTNPTGCTGSVEVVVTVNPIPVVAVPNASICPGGSTILNATGADSYSWTPTTSLSSGTGATVTANPAATTTYTVIGTSLGCTTSSTVVVSVGALVASVSPNVTICFGTSTQLIAGGGSSYSWSPATGLSDPTIFNPVATPTVTTSYTVVVSDVSCSDDAVVIVTVDPPITLNAAPVNVTCFGACNGQTIVIPTGGNGAYSYNWSSGCSTAACNNVCAGTYTLTVTDGFGCTVTGTTTVTEPPPFFISATGGNACPGDSIGLSVTGAVTYSWLPVTALSPTSGSNVIARPASTTTYTIVGTDASGCTAVTTVVATANPKPIAAFTTSPNDANEFNPTIYFYDLSTGGAITKWNWLLGDSANTPSSLQNPVFAYPPYANSYPIQLIVTNQFGCMDTTTGRVFIHGIFTFYIPNTFTPNNDDVNDRFLPRGVGIDETDYHLWIFDRWGNLIWHTDVWGEAWDGKANKGVEVAQIDTYVWKVHVKEKESGTKHNYVGHVNIVK